MKRYCDSPNDMEPHSPAFALMELLVVIAILAALAAVLIPAISSGLHRTRRIKCLSNLRQISQACQMLVDDQPTYLPDRELGCGHWGNAAAQLLPYAGENPQLFICPANRHPLQSEITEILPDLPGSHTMYEFNGYLCSCEGFRRRISDITAYSEAAYAYDFPYRPDAEHRAHKGGVNCAYMDGHAAWLPDEDMGPLDPDTEDTFYKRGHVCWQ